MEFKQLPSPPPTKPATREKVLEFLRGLQKFRRKDHKPFDEQAIKDYINQHTSGSLQGIARRIMMDILKSPTADAALKGERKKKQTAPKPAAAKKRKAASTKGAAKKKTAGRKLSKKASRKK